VQLSVLYRVRTNVCFWPEATLNASPLFLLSDKADDLTSGLFVRSFLRGCGGVEFSLLTLLLAGCDARLMLRVEGAGHGGRAAFLRQGGDGDHEAVLPPDEGQNITAGHGSGGLHALAVQLHMAAVDHVGGQPPRLEEAGGPDPLVDAYALVGHG